MKSGKLLFTVLILLALAGCSNFQLPAFGNPTVTVVAAGTPTASPNPTGTSTHTPFPTLTPTLTFTPSPTVFRTPTETPENFALSESGYDIADVRINYPREDMMVIDFKYRLDESAQANGARILMPISRRCHDYGVNLFYLAEDLVGEGQFTFKMTLEGTCSADSMEFLIYPMEENVYNSTREFAYQEYVLQPYTLVRNFPTLNSDKLVVNNFNFEAQSDWRGVLTFDYRMSEEIPIPPEQYYFAVSSSGQNECYVAANGPTLTEHSGTYELQMDLTMQRPEEDLQCLAARPNYSFSTIRVVVWDELADSVVFSQERGFSYTFWKNR